MIKLEVKSDWDENIKTKVYEVSVDYDIEGKGINIAIDELAGGVVAAIKQFSNDTETSEDEYVKAVISIIKQRVYGSSKEERESLDPMGKDWLVSSVKIIN